MKNIAVIFGGKSVEHDISIITGLQVISNMSEKYCVVPIYITREGDWFYGEKLKKASTFKNFNTSNLWRCYFTPHNNFLSIQKKIRTKRIEIDSVILALHGANGEDGTIQGLLTLSGIPFTCSGVLGSSITIDKAVLKMIIKQNGIKTPDYVCVSKEQIINDFKSVLRIVHDTLGDVVVVKPDRAGSSVGVKKCKTDEELKNAIELALYFDNKIIIEKAIEEFREINVAVLGYGDEIEISCFEEVIGATDVLSFDDKYLNSTKVERIVDIKLNKKIENKIKDYAKKAFSVCEISGVCRMDFFVTKDDVVFLNEINSIPGSMANYLFKDMSFCNLLEKLIIISKKQLKTREELTYHYSSQALLDYEKLTTGKLKK